MIYFSMFFAAINLFNFYSFPNNSLYIRGLNLACCLLLSLITIIEAIKQKKY